MVGWNCEAYFQHLIARSSENKWASMIDMFMQFWGGGVGYKSIRTEMHCLLNDRNKLDERGFEKEKRGPSQGVSWRQLKKMRT